VTRLAPDFVPPEALHDIAVARSDSAQTTTFENTYPGGRREQRLLALADPIEPEDVPPDWRSASIVHLGPVARELDSRFASLFPGALLGVTPQGWLRDWDASRRVGPRVWLEARDILPQVDVLVLSEEDLNGDLDLMTDYAALVRFAVLTRGSLGCVVYADGHAQGVPGFPAHAVDPTGAGDVFAAAFFIRLQETGDAIAAARFANAAGALAVQAPGIAGIPTRDQVTARLAP
jgi:sugar/nucleoside kinase (ribokinase family)